VIYYYTKNVNTDLLLKEIQDSAIVTAINYITLQGASLSIAFKAELSISDETLLTSVVTNHDANAPFSSGEMPVDVKLPVRVKAFSDSEGMRFRGASFIDTVAADSTKSIDYKITEERYINGGKLIVKNMGDDDRITFQVVDKDNIFGFGAGVVLDEFIKDFYLPLNESLNVQLEYPARIMAGLYLRLIYTNTNTTETATVKCNLYLHWRAS
jgi:hypothetical protein